MRIPAAVMLAVVWLAAWATMGLWPTSWWLEVRSVYVGDAEAGEPVPMIVDRTIHRPFLGEWSVVVRKVSGGASETVCTAKGTTNYRPDSTLPDPLLLSWWAYPECDTLPAGVYILTTIWKVQGTTLLPPKYAKADSNPFTVQ
jgi:hypothetical protein